MLRCASINASVMVLAPGQGTRRASESRDGIKRLLQQLQDWPPQLHTEEISRKPVPIAERNHSMCCILVHMERGHGEPSVCLNVVCLDAQAGRLPCLRPHTWFDGPPPLDDALPT